MAPRKSMAKSATAAQRRGGQLMDEVYRQMFRLEDERPGSEMALALALLRAWQSAGADAANLAWLRQICPICISMIEDAVRAQNPSHPLDA